MAQLSGRLRIVATVPDATAMDSAALAAAIATTLAAIVAVAGIDAVELLTYQIELGP